MDVLLVVDMYIRRRRRRGCGRQARRYERRVRRDSLSLSLLRLRLRLSLLILHGRLLILHGRLGRRTNQGRAWEAERESIHNHRGRGTHTHMTHTHRRHHRGSRKRVRGHEMNNERGLSHRRGFLRPFQGPLRGEGENQLSLGEETRENGEIN